MQKIKPSGRTMKEVLASSREDFFRQNGYYGTVEDAIRLTEEAREEIRREKELKKRGG